MNVAAVVFAEGRSMAPLALTLATRSAEELGLAVSLVLTVIGMVLHWQLPEKRMALEERVKDNELTADEAQRWMRFYNFCAPATTLCGLGLLIAVLASFAL